jgi:hypothetical protein
MNFSAASVVSHNVLCLSRPPIQLATAKRITAIGTSILLHEQNQAQPVTVKELLSLKKFIPTCLTIVCALTNK